MIAVNIHEAKTHLSRLLVKVAAGEEVIIAKAGHPVARIVPEYSGTGIRPSGMDQGVFCVPDEFDDESVEITGLFES